MLVYFCKSMREKMWMHISQPAGISMPCHGPAAHILSTALVLLAFEPAAVPMLLKLGLIDAGV